MDVLLYGGGEPNSDNYGGQNESSGNAQMNYDGERLYNERAQIPIDPNNHGILTDERGDRARK